MNQINLKIVIAYYIILFFSSSLVKSQDFIMFEHIAGNWDHIKPTLFISTKIDSLNESYFQQPYFNFTSESIKYQWITQLIVDSLTYKHLANFVNYNEIIFKYDSISNDYYTNKIAIYNNGQILLKYTIKGRRFCDFLKKLLIFLDGCTKDQKIIENFKGFMGKYPYWCYEEFNK